MNPGTLAVALGSSIPDLGHSAIMIRIGIVGIGFMGLMRR